MAEAAERRAPRRREHTALALTIALLLLATVPPLINLSRFQRRIAGAMSRSIGRPVGFDSISLRLLPWPALLLQNFVVAEAPGFGAEPTLRSPEVVAEPRLFSLWRGRFELARVELTDASVNLVRNDTGLWNISSVLLQASRVENAPTAQRKPGPAPRFPYIEATGTRINLKQGVEKLPYALLDADFSMSLASPEVWHLKLEGQPVRTDLDLFANDTGTLRLEGDLHRATAIGTMPLALNAEWKEASLGQLSRLLLGLDADWRGKIDARAQLTGEVDHLGIRTHFVVANLHRQEFTPERTYTVDATCQGLYSRSTPATNSFKCRWPLGAGGLAVSSDPGRDRTLHFDLQRIPADVLAATVGLFHEKTPPPGGFGGELTGNFIYSFPAKTLTGSAAMPTFSLAKATPQGTPLVLTGLALSPIPKAKTMTGRQILPGLAITADPLHLHAPEKTIALSAQILSHAWSIEVEGSAALPDLQAFASALQLHTLDRFSAIPDSDAQVQLALTMEGNWLGGALSTTGSATLQETRWQSASLPFPVDLHAATADFSPSLLRWVVSAGDMGEKELRVHFSAGAQAPLACAEGLPCVTRFALEAPALDAAALETAFTGGRPELIQVLTDRFHINRTRLPALTGTIHAEMLTLGKLDVHDATAVLSTESSPVPLVRFHSLDGSALGGSLHLQGTLSLAGSTPEYRLHAELTNASATEAAALWGESWGPGKLSGTTDLNLAGSTARSLLASARGNFEASWLHGAPAPPQFRFVDWEASGVFDGSGLKLDRGSFSGTPATLTGTVGWDRTLQLQLILSPETSPTAIGGTLAQPEVQPPN